MGVTACYVTDNYRHSIPTLTGMAPISAYVTSKYMLKSSVDVIRSQACLSRRKEVNPSILIPANKTQALPCTQLGVSSVNTDTQSWPVRVQKRVGFNGGWGRSDLHASRCSLGIITGKTSFRDLYIDFVVFFFFWPNMSLWCVYSYNI